MTRRVLTWLKDPDHAFGVVCVCCAPLFTICMIGLFGGGA